VVEFSESAFDKEDHYFVKEDPARIYRGLKDLLVEEFSMDRIEEAKSEFSVSAPRDKIRLHAFKEKSPHTVIHYSLQFRVKSPKRIYKMEHGENILKARVSTSAEVLTQYPGGEDIEWLPSGMKEKPGRNYSKAGLAAEEVSRFQRSKLYNIIVGIWYNKFYAKEIEEYEDEAENVCLHIHDLMREKFGVEKAIGKTEGDYTAPWQ
jgi:hypothetical protein